MYVYKYLHSSVESQRHKSLAGSKTNKLVRAPQMTCLMQKEYIYPSSTYYVVHHSNQPTRSW